MCVVVVVMNRCGSKLLEQWPTLGQLALHWAREAHSASAVRRWAANAATTTTSADRCPFRPVMTSDRKTASTSATATAVPLQCPFRMPPTQEQPTTFKEAETSTSGLAFDQMPSPTGLPLVGNLFDLIKAGGAEYLHRYCDMRHKTLGPIYREKLGNLEVVFISDANMAQKVSAIHAFPQFRNPFLPPVIRCTNTMANTQSIWFPNPGQSTIKAKAFNVVYFSCKFHYIAS